MIKTELAHQFNPNTYRMKVRGQNRLIGQGNNFLVWFLCTIGIEKHVITHRATWNPNTN
jgi:hypothetical protein